MKKHALMVDGEYTEGGASKFAHKFMVITLQQCDAVFIIVTSLLCAPYLSYLALAVHLNHINEQS